jgi:hypothetical protein
LRRALPRGTLYPATRFPIYNGRFSSRGNATASKPLDKKAIEKLPLAGIRVLDMTRVLAGVCSFPFE